MSRGDLIKVCSFLIDNVFQDPDIMFSDLRWDGDKDLPYIIASLFELLHREVTGEPYLYFYHWANKIGANVECDLFLKEVE